MMGPAAHLQQTLSYGADVFSREKMQFFDKLTWAEEVDRSWHRKSTQRAENNVIVPARPH